MQYKIGRKQVPVWFLLVYIILSGLILFYCIIRLKILYDNGTLNVAAYPEIHLRDVPVFSYSKLWGVLDLMMAVLCLFIGLICLILGVARSLNQLAAYRIYLLSGFAILFALNMLVLMEGNSELFGPLLLFHLYWVSFFAYPIPIYLFMYDLHDTRARRWSWAFIAFPVSYAILCALLGFFSYFPLEISSEKYTLVGITCFIILTVIALLKTKSRSIKTFLALIVICWTVWVFYLFVKHFVSRSFQLHNEFKAFVTLLILLFLTYTLYENARDLFQYQSEKEMLELKNTYLYENYQNLEQYFSDIAHMKHDIHHHLAVMSSFTHSGDWEKLQTYLDALLPAYELEDTPVKTGNPIIDAVLGRTASRAKQMDCRLEINATPIPPIYLSDTDLVSLLMNLTENALECCEKEENPSHKWVILSIKSRMPYLYISAKNGMSGELLEVNGGFVTSKENKAQHGRGLSIISNIAEKYNGFLSLEQGEGSFTAEVLLMVLAKEGLFAKPD